ncbi:hypothetical protein FHG87_011926, partial [Trinorchestia longiramus]
AYFHLFLRNDAVNLSFVNHKNETPLTNAPEQVRHYFQEAKSSVANDHTKKLLQEFYFALMVSDQTMLKQSFQNIFQNSQFRPEGVYLGNKTLLYCLTEML